MPSGPRKGFAPKTDKVMFHHGVFLNLSRPDATSGLPERFMGTGEEKTIMEFPEGYGYRYKASDKLGPQPHDPQPHLEGDEARHPVHDRLHPRHRARGGEHDRGAADLDGRPERQQLPGVRRPPRLGGQGREVHLPARRQGPLPRRPPQERLDRGPRRRPDQHRRPRPHRRPLHRPLAEPSGRQIRRAEVQHQAPGRRPASLLGEGPSGQGRHRAPVPLTRQVLRAGGPGLLGRQHEGHPRRLDGPGAQGRQALDPGDLRDEARVLV